MNITITPGKLSGRVTAIPSKSQAHRLLICAAFADTTTELACPQTNQDIDATVSCLCALGAQIQRTESRFYVTPVSELPETATMNCRESGSTLRFILPICCALGVTTTIHMQGRLPDRPLSPLWEELVRMGATLSRPRHDIIQTSGKLKAGNFMIPGNVSSQFISGLLFASALMDGQSKIRITGSVESAPYILMTQAALSYFGICSDQFEVFGKRPLHSPGKIVVEGDWSNAAFFYVANAIGNSLQIENLNTNSLQGDRIVCDLLSLRSQLPTIDARNIPDLVPILSVFFATRNGAVFTGIQRLRIKESDRVTSVCNMLRALGVDTRTTEDSLYVYPAKFHSCTIDAVNDHRIAMSAAIASTVADGPVTILGADCVAKSYPTFWDEFRRLGGIYE